MIQDQVARIALIDFNHRADAVVEESHVQTEVEFLAAFPFEVLVANLSRCKTASEGGDTKAVVGSEQTSLGAVGSNVGVAHLTIADPQFQIREDLQIADELFITHLPGEGTGGEEGPAIGFRQLRGTIGTSRQGQEIFVVECVVDTSHVGRERIPGKTAPRNHRTTRTQVIPQ